MDNADVRRVHEELLRAGGPASAPELAGRLGVPLGLAQAALGRLKRDRLIQAVGSEELTGHERWEPLPGTRTRF